jgi:cellulose synthase/poly-beta-1,6-N-acetylglucosamine synthase-like glycosyltransferase
MQTVFWTAIFFIFYAYLGYPILLMIVALFRNRPVRKGDIAPAVSFIITAYNEEKRIREKIENTLKQDYPRESMEILVASDCSDDRTDEIVRCFESSGVRLVRVEKRGGKEAAQKLAVDAAANEILVFSDVATILPPDGITNIVKNFHDPTVGCVSSVDRIIGPGPKTGGEGAYVRYEMFLRNLETRVGTLVGLSGSFFAARKEVCRNWAVDLQSDFHTLVNAVKLGLRGVSDSDSVGYYKNIADEAREFERKVRTVLRGIDVLMASLPAMNPFRYGLFSWQLLSHKLCRWLVPFAMILAFISNAFLAFGAPVYRYAFLLQLGFYLIAFARLPNLFGRHYLLRIPSFLVLVNLSILYAWYRYVRGQRMVSWVPSER